MTATPQLRRWSPLVLLGLAVVLLLVYTSQASRVKALPKPQLGLASYYGPGFQGRKTASGEPFDQAEMVAAHRTLPLGTVVRVTNLENGRKVVLRIIDRGPYGKNFRKGTIIDVSKGAARKLRFIEDGLVRVRVDVVRRAPRDDDDRAGAE
jgi:peptidoglycan lytic transglycosylase